MHGLYRILLEDKNLRYSCSLAGSPNVALLHNGWLLKKRAPNYSEFQTRYININSYFLVPYPTKAVQPRNCLVSNVQVPHTMLSK